MALASAVGLACLSGGCYYVQRGLSRDIDSIEGAVDVKAYPVKGSSPVYGRYTGKLASSEPKSMHSEQGLEYSVAAVHEKTVLVTKSTRTTVDPSGAKVVDSVLKESTLSDLGRLYFGCLSLDDGHIGLDSGLLSMLPLTPILSTFKSGGGAVLNNVSVTVNMDKGSNGAPETSRGDGSSSSGRNSRGSSGPKSSTTTSADIGTKADVDGIATGTELTLVCDFARMGKATVARQAGGERSTMMHRGSVTQLLAEKQSSAGLARGVFYGAALGSAVALGAALTQR